ncbi:MAG: endonuclease domain-containing protein, partial [Acidobacteriota bacterium]
RTRRVPSARGGAVGRVRELRESSTPAERVLWDRLRGRRFLGLKFRRQFPIEGFVTDFCCYEMRLVVELDGGIHDESAQAAHDENRDFVLHSLGFRILRFPNDRVLHATDLVLEEIARSAGLEYRLG